jgi:prolyl oligopeptidase
MKNTATFLMLIATVFCSCNESGDQKKMKKEMKMPVVTYPDTEKSDQIDTLWGTVVADPYRWLEDDNSDETKSWVQAQNKVTRSFLDSIPFRAEIRQRYEELYNYEKVGSPYKVGDRYFIYKNDGLQNQSVIYVREGKDGEDKVFIDPNSLSADGTVTVNLMGADDTDSYMAISQSEAGSDWSQIRVMDVKTGMETGDVLKWVKFGGASWYKNGFFYSRYPAPEEGDELSAANTFHKIYYHTLGEPQEKDRLVYENMKAPNMYHWAQVTDDDAYMVMYAATGTDGYECYFKDLNKDDAKLQPLFTGFENKSSVIDHINGRFLVITCSKISPGKYRP